MIIKRDIHAGVKVDVKHIPSPPKPGSVTLNAQPPPAASGPQPLGGGCGDLCVVPATLRCRGLLLSLHAETVWWCLWEITLCMFSGFHLINEQNYQNSKQVTPG